ncbi:MAG: metallophosphoesterase family protein [Candidatus Desulforudis sp.]|nr:metallophosphoesterase family protein [Desulforudis sp.]
MKIGLISDTHGELENLREAVLQLVRDHGVDILVHLGDEWEDAEAAKKMVAVDVLTVPGVYAPQYQDRTVPNRLLRHFRGFRVLFTHTAEVHENDRPEDPDPRELAAAHKVNIVAYGHTHVPAAELVDGVLWVNPGHLKSQDKKGHAPSYAVFGIEPRKTEVSVNDLHSKEPFLTQTLKRN